MLRNRTSRSKSRKGSKSVRQMTSMSPTHFHSVFNNTLSKHYLTNTSIKHQMNSI